jgi:hypothetical protein
MGCVRPSNAGAARRGETEEDESLGGEEEAIPGVGEGGTVAAPSGTKGVVIGVSNGTMQTGGTGEGGEDAGHCVAEEGSVKGGASLKGKILSSKVTWRDR